MSRGVWRGLQDLCERKVSVRRELIEHARQPRTIDGCEPVESKAHPHTFDPAGDARAGLIPRDPRAERQLGEELLHGPAERPEFVWRPREPVEVMPGNRLVRRLAVYRVEAAAQ